MDGDAGDADETDRYRLALQRANVIAAESDTQLRYLWIANPHPDFDARTVLGKRDDELAAGEGVARLMALKRDVLESGRGRSSTITFSRSNGMRTFDIAAEPMVGRDGEITGVRTAAVDVTGRAAAEAELRQRDGRRATLLSTLAHEIRNAAHVAAMALQAEPSQVASQTGFIAIARRQLVQLERLAEDLMDASRLARGTLSLKKRAIELSSLIGQAVDACSADLESAGLDLIVDRPSHSIGIDGDPDRLLQVLHNLIGNAAKFTPRGGRVTVRLESSDGEVRIAVTDDGVGIAPGDLDAIFEPFEQVGEQKERGIGVGLGVAKALVELHGGTIEAFSRGQDTGSEFRISLPRAGRRGTP